MGGFSRIITCKTRIRMCDPKRKTKCDPIYDADGNTKVGAALKFPRRLSATCGGSQRHFKYFSESGGRYPWLMPPFGTQSSFPPSLLCTSPKGFKSKVSCFSLPSLSHRRQRQRQVRLASFPVLTAQFVFLFV